jgi:hypothetical protein
MIKHKKHKSEVGKPQVAQKEVKQLRKKKLADKENYSTN